jgi:outer membrane protein TolC
MQGDLGCKLASAALIVLAAVAVARAQDAAPTAQGTSASAPPVVITLEEAVRRAEASDPAYAAATGASQSAALDKGIARAGLLPSIRGLSQDIYVQPNGIFTEGDAGQPSAPLPRFVSYDARPWEYIAMGVADESISLGGAAALRRADAAAAQAAAEQEIARRGLVAGVTALFYASLAAEQDVAIAQQALQDAAGFTKITREREQAREAAHADVVKAELTQQAMQRGLQDAQVADGRARLELGVLLFADPRTPYKLSAPAAPPPLPSRADVQAAAAKNNPELKSALAAVKVSDADLMAARGAYLPNAMVSVNYGIDANQFATRGPLNSTGFAAGLQARNLGYSVTATVNLPVWDWLATQHKVKQSEIHQQVAKVTLTNTQRQLIARLDEAYAEAATARDQLASLDQSVSTAAESLRLTRLAYQGGDAAVLAVVDAQSAYVQAETARQSGMVRYQNALAALQTLTGTM